MSGDFDALREHIDKRRDSLVDRLTQQYRDSHKRMSEMEEKLRAENKSLVAAGLRRDRRLIKKIIAFKNMLMSVLAEGGRGDRADHRRPHRLPGEPHRRRQAGCDELPAEHRQAPEAGALRVDLRCVSPEPASSYPRRSI